MNRVLHGCGKGKSLKLWPFFKQMESLHLGQPYTIRYSLCDGDIPTKTIAMLPEQQDAKRAVYVYY